MSAAVPVVVVCHGALHCSTPLCGTAVLDRTAQADWSAHFSQWGSAEEVAELASAGMVWKLPPAGSSQAQAAAEAKAKAAAGSENRQQLQRLAAVQITHAQNRSKAAAVREAKAVGRSNKAGFHDGTVPHIRKNTLALARSPADNEELAPFYVVKLLEDTDPDADDDSEVQVQYWEPSTNTKFKFEGPWNLGKTKGPIPQNSIFWQEDLPMDAPDYKQLKPKACLWIHTCLMVACLTWIACGWGWVQLFKKNGSRVVTRRTIYKDICAMLMRHPSVHESLFAYKK